MFILQDVVDGSNSASASAENEPSDNEGMLDEDCDNFASITSSELHDEEHREPSSPRQHDEQPSDLEFAPLLFPFRQLWMPPIPPPSHPPPPTLKESLLVGNPSPTFLHNHKTVFLSLDLGRSQFKVPNAQKSYSKYFNAVDRNDFDSADYTTSLRTNRWYLHIFFWLLNREVHQCM